MNLLGLDHSALVALTAELNEPAFRAQQIMQWIHQRFVTDWEQMTNLSKALRTRLSQACTIEPLYPSERFDSDDGTRKWLFPVGKSHVEAVLIPEPSRNTLCISSQAGCLLDCSFCATGKQGFDVNLTSAQIISQLWYVQKWLHENNKPPVTNVVMMGMGEPLLNVPALAPALALMRHDLAYGLSWKRVTVSTSGVVPEIAKLATWDVSFALSLHAPNDALRNTLVPLNKKYPLKVLLAACTDFLAHNPKKHITIEYVMLNGVNDSPQHAKEMIRLLAHLRVKINLIPYNPFPGVAYTCSSDETIAVFQGILKDSGFITTVRRPRGRDIKAACGQLAGQVRDRTHRQARWLKQVRPEDHREHVSRSV